MKNSAGVKFNDATELIIEADPDGTVTSCFNKSNNTEYVGGGSSDFSTAQVTFGDLPEDALYFPCYFEAEDPYPAATDSYAPAPNETVNIVLYKGTCIENTPEPTLITGSASYDNVNFLLIITGDCTISWE